MLPEKVDPRPFFELLYDHQSQDFKKARRNIMIFSSVVISSWILGQEIAIGKWLNQNNGEVDIFRSYIIFLVLLVYWWVMYEIYRNRDKKIQTRKIEIVQSEIRELERLRENFKRRKASSTNDSDRGILGADISKIEGLLRQHEESEEKNRSALKWASIVESIELWIPRIVSGISVCYLACQV